MSERHPACKPLAGRLQGIAHVAQEEEFGGRYATGMSSNMTFANINLPIRKALAQVVISAAVAKPELEDISFQLLDQTRRQIEAGTLGLQAADKAVKPAHNRLGGDAGAFA